MNNKSTCIKYFRKSCDARWGCEIFPKAPSRSCSYYNTSSIGINLVPRAYLVCVSLFIGDAKYEAVEINKRFWFSPAYGQIDRQIDRLLESYGSLYIFFAVWRSKFQANSLSSVNFQTQDVITKGIIVKDNPFNFVAILEAVQHLP